MSLSFHIVRAYTSYILSGRLYSHHCLAPVPGVGSLLQPVPSEWASHPSAVFIPVWLCHQGIFPRRAELVTAMGVWLLSCSLEGRWTFSTRLVYVQCLGKWIEKTPSVYLPIGLCAQDWHPELGFVDVCLKF